MIQVEGDPASPISRGRLCPKGAATKNMHDGPLREYKVKYRRPYGTAWEELPLDEAMEMIVDRIVATREETWEEETPEGNPAKRTMGDREPRRRDARQRGELPDQEAPHRARHRPGREPGPHMTQLHGAQSGHLVRARRRHRLPAGPAERGLHHDHGLEHGGEPSRRLPVGDGGARAGRARCIHVDPRFTRTSAMATKHVGIRAGSRHRVPRRRRQLHPRERALVRRVRQALHERAGDRRRASSRTPRTTTASSPAGTPRRASTT